MKRGKRLFVLLFSVVVLVTLTACGLSNNATVKIGLVGDQQDEWEYVKDVLKDQGIDLELVKFTDYVSPNQGLADGSLDLNSYQHSAYLESWNEEYGDEDRKSVV